jgi:hypothetical protein
MGGTSGALYQIFLTAIAGSLKSSEWVKSEAWGTAFEVLYKSNVFFFFVWSFPLL